MPEVIQLCAPPENPAYHLSLKDLSTFLELNYSHLLKQTVFSTVEAYEEFLAFVKGVVKVRQGIELLQKANRVIHCVAHTPWFECSIPPEAILDLSAQKHIELTVAFVLRGIHDRHLKRGIPLTNSDKIIECLEDPSISAQITLAPSVKALPLEDLKDRLYHALCVNRKTFATLDQSTHEWIYARDRPSQKKMVVEIPVLEEGVTPLQWAVRHPIPLSIGSRFLISPLDKSCVIQVNHMYSDGIGMLFHANSILESITREIGEPVVETRTPSQKSPRELSLFEDVWVGLRYGAWLLKDAVAQAFWLPEKPKLAGQKTVEEWQAPTKSIQLRQGMSFTESYLQDILNAKKDIHQAIRVCIPANTQSPLTRMKEPAQNQTSLYYQDFRADESESEFKEKFKVFRSATAKWIALILGGLLATWIPWLLKKCTNSIDILFSSLYVPPEFQKDLEPRIAIPLQSGQSLGVCCVTMEDTTFQCIVGRGTQVQKLASGLGKI